MGFFDPDKKGANCAWIYDIGYTPVYPSVIHPSDVEESLRIDLRLTAQDFKLIYLNAKSFPVRAYDKNGFAYRAYGCDHRKLFVIDSLATLEGD